MHKTICNNYDFLKSLARTRSLEKRRKLLKGATTEQLLALVEISLNILQNRFKITKQQRKRLLPHADFIRQLSRLRSERGARRLVIQKGSGLPLAIFPALLTPIITEIAKSLITSAISPSS